jgi:hypothetical protein
MGPFDDASRRDFLWRSGLLAAAGFAPWLLRPVGGRPAGAAPAPAPASTSSPIAGEPWKGLTVVKVKGDGAWAAAMTRYCVSITDVDPITATGDQYQTQRDGRSRITLRFEWNSTNSGTNSRATTAWIYLRYPDGGGKIGTSEWVVPINEAPYGGVTRSIHLDTDPMNGTIDVPLAAGLVEMYLYLEKKTDNIIRWSADSRGGAWGQFPKSTTYARGTLGVLSPGVMIGYHVGRDPHGTCDDKWSPDGETCQTDSMGKRCAAVRIYSPRWEKPSGAVDRTMAQGKLPMWSVKPPSGGWKAVADGTATNPTVAELVDALKAYDKEIIFIFHHEPHDDVNGSTNTDASYRGAVLRLKDQLLRRGAHHTVGGKVHFAYAPTLWDAKKGNPQGSGDRFYPGDGVFDIFAPTSYNWYDWIIGDGRWHSFEDVMYEAVALARKRVQKLFPSETGSHPAKDGYDRNEWLRDAKTYLRTNDDARSVFVGFIYFHVEYQDAGEWHDWTLFKPDGSGGYGDGFGRDGYFTSAPFSLH